MSQTFDAIVAGTGGFGSSCLFHLANRGLKVLGLDRFPTAHDRGSSHGETRIIRQAYFEHPDYVPLLLRSYDLWHRLEQESGADLLTVCGLFMAGPPEGEVVAGTRLAAHEHGVTIENVTPKDAATRFAGFQVPAGFDVVYEQLGGVLSVESCLKVVSALACRAGAVIESGHSVESWESDGQRVRVQTSKGVFEAASLILTPGAWASDLLAGVPGMPTLEVLRKVMFWNPVRSDVFNIGKGGCGFLLEMPTGAFYGFPSFDGKLIKVAEHTGGTIVADPLTVDRRCHSGDVEPISDFLASVMPSVDPVPARHSVCMYTVTPDRHFIVDRHPEFSNVCFGAGFSGHGFKFATVIGEALCQLVVDGKSELPIEFLGL